MISFQTNHRERVKALKEGLFRFNLNERWFVVFCGKEEHFKINDILNRGDQFCGLFQCDIQNCIEWVHVLLEVGCSEIEKFRELIEDPMLLDIMMPRAQDMNRQLAQNMQLDDGENTREYRQYMASDVTEQVIHPGGEEQTENSDAFFEEVQFTFVADPLMQARSQVEGVLRGLVELIEDEHEHSSDEDSTTDGNNTSSSNIGGGTSDTEVIEVTDHSEGGSDNNNAWINNIDESDLASDDDSADDKKILSSRITFKVQGKPLNEYTDMNVILSQLFVHIFHQGYDRPNIAPCSGYLNRTDRRKVLLYADRVAARCSPLLQTLFDMFIRQTTARKTAFRAKAGRGAQDRALSLFKKELRNLPDNVDFADPVIAKRMAPIMRKISEVIAVHSTPIPWGPLERRRNISKFNMLSLCS